MRIKANNQYYGEQLEVETCSSLGFNSNFEVDFNFTDEDKKIIEKHGKIVSNTIKKYYPDYKNVLYNGRNTVTTTGDITVDDNSIELKYVSSGFGTYHNTSINYFTTLGLMCYKDFLEQHNYYDFLENLAPLKPNKETSSPYTNSESSFMRKNHRNIYNAINKKERFIRELYTQYIFKELQDNPEIRNKLFTDFIKKNTSINDYKEIPDLIIAVNWKNDKVKTIRKDLILNTIKDVDNMTATKTGIIFNNVLRIQIGWQNGNGLNNPTLRASLLIK